MFGISAGDMIVHGSVLPQESPPEGFYKLLFCDGKHLFIMTEELMKYPFFNVITNGEFKEAKHRVIDLSDNEYIKIEIFNLMRKLMQGKKKDVFEDTDLSLLEDPRFFDELQACFEFLYPKQAVVNVEHSRREMLDRLHQRVLCSINVSYAIRLYNAFAQFKIDDLKKYPLEILREEFHIAHDSVIFRDVIEYLIVTKTIFNADIHKAESFFQYFHDLRKQMIYLKSKESSVAQKHLQSIAHSYRNSNWDEIGKINCRLAELSLEMEDLQKTHKEFEEKKKEMMQDENPTFDQSVIEFEYANRVQEFLKKEKEFCYARNLRCLTERQKKFHAQSISTLDSEISKLCFHVLLPKQALCLLEMKEATPLERYIAHSVLHEFRRCILQTTLKDNRFIFPFREDMVDWCVKLLAFYNFQIVNDEIQHPFQLAAVKNGTLPEENYKNGFRYLFTNHTPEDLQVEIRSDLKICGMTEEEIGPKMEDVPDFSNTFLDLERGVLVILKKIFKQITRVEEIPSFQIVKHFVILLRYYWENVLRIIPNHSFRIYLSFMDLGKPWNLHAQTPIELERLFREKLTVGARFSYIDSSQQFLLKKVHDFETDMEYNHLRIERFSEVIDLPPPLYDK